MSGVSLVPVIVVSIVSIAEPHQDRDDYHSDAPAYKKKDQY
jgi:hypothetical protein